MAEAVTLDKEYDVVIAGSGAGGLVAALRLKRAGLRAVVVEKQSVLGGSTAISGGQIWAPGSAILKAAGISDSAEEALTYLEALDDGTGGAGATPARRRAYVDNVPPLVELLLSTGMALSHCTHRSDYYDELPGGKPEGRSLETELFNGRKLGPWLAKLQGSGYRYPMRGTEARPVFLAQARLRGKVALAKMVWRMFKQRIFGEAWLGTGAGLQSRMLLACVEAGVPIFTSTPVMNFIVEDGRIRGVTVEHEGRRVDVMASRGVLLNSGGFARNPDLRNRYGPAGASVDYTVANLGDTGELIERAIALGAATDLMDEAWWVPTSLPPNGARLLHVPDLGKPGCILVDRFGRRFVDEAGSYMEAGQKILALDVQPGEVPCWAVTDHRFRSRYAWGATLPFQVPDTWIESGYLKRFDTLDDLANACGIDAATLARTVERFNADSKRGQDSEFQRGARQYDHYYGDPDHRPNPNLGPIDKPPYYAVAIYPGDVGTAGGLVADEKARVLTTGGEVIDGLYAAGNCTAPVFGRRYPGAGASIGASAIFGLIAADQMIGNGMAPDAPSG